MNVFFLIFFLIMVLFFNSFFSSRFSLLFSLNFKIFKNLDLMLMSIFCSIVFLKFLGLIPFSIPFSAHMEFFVIFSMSVVFTLILSNFFFNYFSFFVHFIPYSCPLFLTLFLFLIEVMSLFIRPLTLALRLGANMTSGHMILGMVMGIFVLTPFFYFFEIFVCFIQGYIFFTLVSVYSSEHSTF